MESAPFLTFCGGISSGPAIICGPIWDHLRFGDHLRAGITCGPVQNPWCHHSFLHLDISKVIERNISSLINVLYTVQAMAIRSPTKWFYRNYFLSSTASVILSDSAIGRWYFKKSLFSSMKSNKTVDYLFDLFQINFSLIAFTSWSNHEKNVFSAVFSCDKRRPALREWNFNTWYVTPQGSNIRKIANWLSIWLSD